MRKYELTDAQWEKIRDMLPTNNRPGRPWRSHRQSLNGILWILNSGAPWRDLPERYGSWKTVYDRFRRWQRDGTLAKIFHILQFNFPIAVLGEAAQSPVADSVGAPSSL